MNTLNIQQIDDYDSLLMKTVAKQRSNWAIDDWVLGIHSIYGDRNTPKSPMEMWLHVANDTSQLSEEVRKGNLEVVVQDAAKIFGRVCVLVGKYLYQKEFPENDPIKTLLRNRDAGDDFIGGRESYGKWILEKYPMRCGTCWETVCVCSAYRPIMENRDEYIELYDEVTKGREQKIMEIKKSSIMLMVSQVRLRKNFFLCHWTN